jgi:hypothetical protein
MVDCLYIYVCMYVCMYVYVTSIRLSFRALRGSSAPDFGQDEAEQLYLMARYESTVTVMEGVGNTQDRAAL